jgi:hypothetical protein
MHYNGFMQFICVTMIVQFVPSVSCVIASVYFVWWLRLRAIPFVSIAFMQFCL